MKFKYLIGIDEVGRGPLAGPVTVVAIAIMVKSKIKNKKLKIFNGIKDSKKLSKKQREIWFKNIKNNPDLVYAIANVSNKVIDKIGMTKSIGKAVFNAVKKLEKKIDINSKNSFIFLDGSLKAPKEYNQKTIIKGDEKIPIISAASIIAKVSRDKLMARLHKKFPQYGFDKHKGYGVKFHYQMIKKYGSSEIHRKLFLRNLK